MRSETRNDKLGAGGREATRIDAMSATFNRARLEILHYVLNFCVSTRYEGSDKPFPGLEAFNNGRGQLVRPGDLVILHSAPVSKSTIGWLTEVEIGSNGFDDQFTIKSLEDGSLCRWHNVSLVYFPRDKILARWRWSDRQFAFNDKWNKVCQKKGEYLDPPREAEFEGGAVGLGTRSRWGLDDVKPTRFFDNWCKVTREQMATAYDECVAEHKAAAEAARKIKAATTHAAIGE